jgi:hypothetical protein
MGAGRQYVEIVISPLGCALTGVDRTSEIQPAWTGGKLTWAGWGFGSIERIMIFDGIINMHLWQLILLRCHCPVRIQFKIRNWIWSCPWISNYWTGEKILKMKPESGYCNVELEVDETGVESNIMSNFGPPDELPHHSR